MGEVVGDLELDRGELDSAYVLDELGEAGGPAARLPTEDHLKRPALRLVGALVDEKPHGRLGAVPDVTYK